MGEPALSPGSYLVYFQCDPKVTLVEAACLSDSQGGALLYLLLCWGPQLALLLLSTLVARWWPFIGWLQSLFSRLPSFLLKQVGLLLAF